MGLYYTKLTGQLLIKALEPLIFGALVFPFIIRTFDHGLMNRCIVLRYFMVFT